MGAQAQLQRSQFLEYEVFLLLAQHSVGLLTCCMRVSVLLLLPTQYPNASPSEELDRESVGKTDWKYVFHSFCTLNCWIAVLVPLMRPPLSFLASTTRAVGLDILGLDVLA